MRVPARCAYCKLQTHSIMGGEAPVQQLRCAECGHLISLVDTTPIETWVDAEVARKGHLQDTGQLGSRKQAKGRTEADVAREGALAEFAACLVLCPKSFTHWQTAVQSDKENTGRDFLRAWTGLQKPIEVRSTPYQSWSKGYLLVRPPAKRGKEMREEFVTDSIYLLVLTTRLPTCNLIGWIAREGFLSLYEENPVGRDPDQCECWGVHWRKLNHMKEFPLPALS